MIDEPATLDEVLRRNLRVRVERSADATTVRVMVHLSPNDNLGGTWNLLWMAAQTYDTVCVCLAGLIDRHADGPVHRIALTVCFEKDIEADIAADVDGLFQQFVSD